MFKKSRILEITLIATLVIAGLSTSLTLLMNYGIKSQRRMIAYKHKEIEKLQKRLISAQITTSKLDQVKKLINENVALSDNDTLAQGASLQFLRALTAVLDQLKIKLISLDPQKPDNSGYFIETPYKMTVECSYEQLCKLSNKMEKSSRLISLKEFTLENYLEEYFNSGDRKKDAAVVTLKLTTLTLIKD